VPGTTGPHRKAGWALTGNYSGKIGLAPLLAPLAGSIIPLSPATELSTYREVCGTFSRARAGEKCSELFVTYLEAPAWASYTY